MYSALYRRLRPRRFDGVAGQDIIVRTLKNQVKAGRLSHAYLFCGTRGTGKTSMALIFAKAINCEKPTEGEPCGQCLPCVQAAEGTSFNIIEMDAASNNGVDNIREIREEIKYSPAMGTHKVYIIDEAHMLSASAFNALLKTLEEPPPGVIFILATTDPGKIPVTVHSRCQRFDFKRLSVKTMTDAVLAHLKNEGIECEPQAAAYAASLADGSMRDMLSIIDQVSAVYMNETITAEKIADVTGAVGREPLYKLVAAFRESDSEAALSVIDGCVKNGKDIHHLSAELLVFLRDLLIAKAAGDKAKDILELSEENLRPLHNAAEFLSVEALTGYIEAINEMISKMRYASNPRVLLEAVAVGLSHK